MPTQPTYAEAVTMMKNACAAFRSTYNFGNSASPNFEAKDQALYASLKGDYGGSIYGPVYEARRFISNAILSGADSVRACIMALAQVLDFPETDADQAFQRVYQYFVDNTKSVNSREMTYGSVSAVGSPVGNGSIHRLTVDKFGFDIEACVAETKTAKVIADETSGARPHEEVFEVRGEPAEVDALKFDGSGVIGNLTALSGLTSQQFLINPSFDNDAAADPATVVTGWTPGTSVSNFAIVSSSYRTLFGVTSPKSVRFKTNDKLSQGFFARGIQLDPITPWYLQVALQRESSCDGTATIRCGSNSKAVTVSTLTNGVWSILKLDLNKFLFFDNFNEANLDVEIELASRTTGTLLVDDVTFGPMQFLGGLWHAPVGGSTKWRRNDAYNWTDSEGATALLQWFLTLAGYYLPGNKVGGETETDPSL